VEPGGYPDQIGLCSVVAAELAFGVAKGGSARNRQALERFLAPLMILPFDDPLSGPMAIYGLAWNAAALRLARSTR
jgi:predicted nucleic acid-binding protein